MSSLKYFRKRLEHLKECKNLPNIAKAAAAEIVADKITRCLWQPWAKEEANELASEFMIYSQSLGGWTADGQDWLGTHGQLG